jgi:hypothetical protein
MFFIITEVWYSIAGLVVVILLRSGGWINYVCQKCVRNLIESWFILLLTFVWVLIDLLFVTVSWFVSFTVLWGDDPSFLADSLHTNLYFLFHSTLLLFLVQFFFLCVCVWRLSTRCGVKCIVKFWLGLFLLWSLEFPSHHPRWKSLSAAFSSGAHAPPLRITTSSERKDVWEGSSTDNDIVAEDHPPTSWL